MPELDIFQNDAFSVRSLTTSINKLPFQPKMLGGMNLFRSKPHISDKFMVEEQNGKLSLIPMAARGTLPTAVTRPGRSKRPFATVHLPQHSALLADEVLGIRAFGSETALESVSKVVNDLLSDHKRNLEATKEWQRVGAIQGIVYDADGSTVIENFFTAFAITENLAAIDFTDAALELKTWCSGVTRTMEGALGADTYSGLTAICGNNWWDAFIVLDEVKAAYDRWQDGKFLRENQLRTGFPFGGINFVNYRGSVGSQTFFPTAEARIIPTGVMDLFEEHMAPAPFLETVNTRGQAFYSKQKKMDFDLGIEFMSCSDVLMLPTRPATLIKSVGTFT